MTDTFLVEVIGERNTRELLKSFCKLCGSKTDHIGKLFACKVGVKFPVNIVTESQKFVSVFVLLLDRQIGEEGLGFEVGTTDRYKELDDQREEDRILISGFLEKFVFYVFETAGQDSGCFGVIGCFDMSEVMNGFKDRVHTLKT